MKIVLTQEEAAEIYYALWSKKNAIEAGHYGPPCERETEDEEWIADLEQIIEKIGPDGENLT